MEREIIFKIMKYSGITPEEALLLKNKVPQIEIIGDRLELLNKVIKHIETTIKNESDDLTAFQLYQIQNKLHISININSEIGYDNFDEEDDELLDNGDRLQWLSEKQKQKVRKAEEYILSKDSDDLLQEIVDFILEIYPDLLKNYNRFYSHEGFTKFLKKIGSEFYYLSDKAQDSMRYVQNNIDVVFSQKIHDFEKENIDEYLEKYLAWANENYIVKHTKQNIKLFLKQNGLKLMNPTIDEIKIMANQK